MPQKITCSECEKVLYEGDVLKAPQDVIKKFEGTCPVCGKDLEFNAENVVVSPSDE
jgi:hypothetical protein